MFRTEAEHTSYFDLSIVLEVPDWILLAWKTDCVLKIGFWRMYSPAEFTGETITLQSDLVSHPFSRVLKGSSHSIPCETSQDARGYLFIVPGRRGLSISWMILILEEYVSCYCLTLRKKSNQNKKPSRAWEQSFLCLTKHPSATGPPLQTGHKREFTKTRYL